MTTRTVLIERAARAILPMWFHDPCPLENYPGQALHYKEQARKYAEAALDALVPPGEAAITETGVLAQIMFREGFATGHGDTFDDMLDEFRWQVCERAERNRRAQPDTDNGS